jgi:hypothetical protein
MRIGGYRIRRGQSITTKTGGGGLDSERSPRTDGGRKIGRRSGQWYSPLAIDLENTPTLIFWQAGNPRIGCPTSRDIEVVMVSVTGTVVTVSGTGDWPLQ